MKKRVAKQLLIEKAHPRSDGRNLLRSIFTYGFVETNKSKAFKLKILVDRLVNYAFKDKLMATRLINQKVANLKITRIILKYGESIKDKRKSGFISVKKSGFRRGDATLMVRATLLDFVNETSKKKEVKKITDVKKN